MSEKDVLQIIRSVMYKANVKPGVVQEVTAAIYDATFELEREASRERFISNLESKDEE